MGYNKGKQDIVSVKFEYLSFKARLNIENKNLTLLGECSILLYCTVSIIEQEF